MEAFLVILMIQNDLKIACFITFHLMRQRNRKYYYSVMNDANSAQDPNIEPNMTRVAFQRW